MIRSIRRSKHSPAIKDVNRVQSRAMQVQESRLKEEQDDEMVITKVSRLKAQEPDGQRKATADMGIMPFAEATQRMNNGQRPEEANL